MGTYIQTCAEVKTADGWQPISYGVFPPVLWHDMDGYEAPRTASHLEIRTTVCLACLPA
jgi:hypothetical protein